MKKKICEIILTLFITLILVFLSDKIVFRKDSKNKYDDFFIFKDKIDVIFLGTSHVMNGVLPLELWDEYGITSYNFGNGSAEMATSYWVLKNLLDYVEPKLIVVDCFGLNGNTKVSSVSFEYIHTAMDRFPLSKNKILSAYDLYNDINRMELINQGILSPQEKGSMSEIIFPFSIYHARWDNIDSKDFLKNGQYDFGAYTQVGVADPNPNEKAINKWSYNNTLAYEYLEKIITLCKEREIQVVLIYLPFPETEAYWNVAYTGKEIATKYGVDYVNLFGTDLVNMETDMHDKNSHLNASGAKKITHFLGNYVTEKQGIIDHRDDEKYKDFNELYDEYFNKKVRLLREQINIESYLMLCNDKDFSVEIACTSDLCIYKDLIENINTLGMLNINYLFENEISAVNTIIVKDVKTNKVIDGIEIVDGQIRHIDLQ